MLIACVADDNGTSLMLISRKFWKKTIFKQDVSETNNWSHDWDIEAPVYETLQVRLKFAKTHIAAKKTYHVSFLAQVKLWQHLRLWVDYIPSWNSES